MRKSINQNEMKKLIIGLVDREIDFNFSSFYNGVQVTCVNEEGKYIWDAICHEYSYGGISGLIEVMGLPQCEGDVIGRLTADEVLELVDEANK